MSAFGELSFPPPEDGLVFVRHPIVFLVANARRDDRERCPRPLPVPRGR